MPDDPDLSPPTTFPEPDQPTPPQGVPVPPPYLPPSQPQGGFSGYPQQGSGYPPGSPQPAWPSYLDTPAPPPSPTPVLSRTETDKPPADFDG